MPSPPASAKSASEWAKEKEKERKRSRSGCLVCKVRKVKCDESPGSCVNCLRLEVECPGYSASAPVGSPDEAVGAIFARAGRKRRRMTTSCAECRATKSRCSGETPCERCARKRIPCEYRHTSPRPKKAALSRSLSPRTTEPSERTESIASIGAEGARQHSWVETVLERRGSSPRFGDQGRRMEARDRFAWLFDENLPQDGRQLRQLVEIYFADIAPLRSWSFIHKSSFMRALDEGSLGPECGTHLLLAICALAAKLLLWNEAPQDAQDSLVRPRCTAVGEKWANKAQSLILADLNDISVEKLMTVVLLCEHRSRSRQDGAAFMLSSIAVRAAQALLLDVDPEDDFRRTPTPAQITAQESRRRLMWSCYLLDLHMCCGVRRITLLDPNGIKIQLPCQERNYALQIPCVTTTLSPEQSTSNHRDVQADNLGLEAYYIKVSHIHGKILTQIRTSNAQPPPWTSSSWFQELTNELEGWERQLPVSLQFTGTNMYSRRDLGQLSALVALHLMFHQAFCDLYRITLPGYRFPATATFDGATKSFMEECQRRCHFHAVRISVILEAALRHGRSALADTMCTIFSFESARHQIVYLAACSPEDYRRQLWDGTSRNLLVNLSTLQELRGLTSIADDCISSIHELLTNIGLSALLNPVNRADMVVSSSYNSSQARDMVPKDLHNLHPFAPYRLVRESISRGRAAFGSSTAPIPTPQSLADSASSPPVEEVAEQAVSAAMYADYESFFAGLDFERIASENQQLLAWDPMYIGAGLSTGGFNALENEISVEGPAYA